MHEFFLSVSSFFPRARSNKRETISVCLVTATSGSTYPVWFRKWMVGFYCKDPLPAYCANHCANDLLTWPMHCLLIACTLHRTLGFFSVLFSDASESSLSCNIYLCTANNHSIRAQILPRGTVTERVLGRYFQMKITQPQPVRRKTTGYWKMSELKNH